MNSKSSLDWSVYMRRYIRSTRLRSLNCGRLYMSYTRNSSLYIMHTVRRSPCCIMEKVQRHRQVIHQTMESDTSDSSGGFADRLVRSRYTIWSPFERILIWNANLVNLFNSRGKPCKILTEENTSAELSFMKSLGRIIGRKGGALCWKESKFWEPVSKSHFRPVEEPNEPHRSFGTSVQSSFLSQIFESFY